VRDRLRGEEVDEAIGAAPVDVLHDRERQVQRVARAARGLLALLGGEHGKLLGVRRVRPAVRVAQDGTVHAHLVGCDHGAARIAEQPGVHEGKVAEVREVLDLAGRIAGPREGPRADGAPARVVELGDIGQGPGRRLQRHPHDPVALERGIDDRARPRRHARGLGELRDRRARAVGAVAPAVVGADDLVPLHTAEGQGRAPVHAHVAKRARHAAGVAPEHEGLAEQRGGVGRARDVGGVRDGMPARAKGGHTLGEHGGQYGTTSAACTSSSRSG
jgi:hypothetical protein